MRRNHPRLRRHPRDSRNVLLRWLPDPRVHPPLPLISVVIIGIPTLLLVLLPVLLLVLLPVLLPLLLPLLPVLLPLLLPLLLVLLVLLSWGRTTCPRLTPPTPRRGWGRSSCPLCPPSRSRLRLSRSGSRRNVTLPCAGSRSSLLSPLYNVAQAPNLFASLLHKRLSSHV